MEKKYFSSGIFLNSSIFTAAKKYIKYFSGTTQIDSWKSNGIPEEDIENIAKSDTNFAPTFVDHHLLPDITFNVPSLINRIYIPKKVINICFLHIKSMVTKFKRRFYIKELLTSICKAN